jgi:hypothetical protein
MYVQGIAAQEQLQRKAAQMRQLRRIVDEGHRAHVVAQEEVAPSRLCHFLELFVTVASVVLGAVHAAVNSVVAVGVASFRCLFSIFAWSATGAEAAVRSASSHVAAHVARAHQQSSPEERSRCCQLVALVFLLCVVSWCSSWQMPRLPDAPWPDVAAAAAPASLPPPPPPAAPPPSSSAAMSPGAAEMPRTGVAGLAEASVACAVFVLVFFVFAQSFFAAIRAGVAAARSRLGGTAEEPADSPTYFSFESCGLYVAVAAVCRSVATKLASLLRPGHRQRSSRARALAHALGSLEHGAAAAAESRVANQQSGLVSAR